MKQPSVPARISDIKPFLVMDIMERAHQLEAQGREVIHLEVGEPDFDTPEVITRAAENALRAGPHPLYGGPGDSRTARGDRGFLQQKIWRIRIARARDGDERHEPGPVDALLRTHRCGR